MAAEPVAVAVGYDRFTFDLILAKACDAGVRVWPLPADNDGLSPGIVALAEHRILVKPKDLAALRALIAEVDPSHVAEQGQLSPAKRLLHRLLTSFRL